MNREEYLRSIKVFLLPGEIWQDVENYNGIYQVSNYGRIKCLPKPAPFNGGRKEKILRPRRHPKGYIQMALFKNGVREHIMLHRLVALAFIPNPNPHVFDQVNHKNGIKENNKVDNLGWSNNSLNQRHAFTHGLHSGRKGANNNWSRFKSCEILEIRRLYFTGKFNTVLLSKMFKTTTGHICRIIHRESWCHI